jgi:hypothetical protein
MNEDRLRLAAVSPETGRGRLRRAARSSELLEIEHPSSV